MVCTLPFNILFVAILFFCGTIQWPRRAIAQNTTTPANSNTLGAFCTAGGNECGYSSPLACIINNNCTYGYCGCANNTFWDYTNLVCASQAAALTQPCASGGAACVVENSACTGGYCQCISGYVQTLSIDGLVYECAQTEQTGAYGIACYDSNNCISPLACTQTTMTCGCETGMTYTGNPRKPCIPNGVGGSCTSDNDCVFSNSQCNNGTGTCACAGGYQNVNWWYAPTMSQVSACIGISDVQLPTGAQCNAALRYSSNLPCSSSSICTACNAAVNSTGICTALPTVTIDSGSWQYTSVMSNGNAMQFNHKLFGAIIIFFVLLFSI